MVLPVPDGPAFVGDSFSKSPLDTGAMPPKNPPHSLAVACPRPNLNEHRGTRAISHSIPRRTPRVNTDGVRWFAESSARLRFTWHRSVHFVHHCDIAAMPEKNSRTKAREPLKSRKSRRKWLGRFRSDWRTWSALAHTGSRTLSPKASTAKSWRSRVESVAIAIANTLR